MLKKNILILITILLFSNYSSHSSVALTDGLIAHFTFSGNLNDSSTSANNLSTTTAGVFLDTDRFGNNASALRLGSTVDFARSDKNLGLSGNIAHTISVWVKSSYPNNHWGTGTIIQFGDPTQNGAVNALKIESQASGRVEMWGQYADYNAPNLFDVFLNWTQIVYTYTDNIFNSAIYINGNAASSEIAGMYLTTTYNLANTPINIGRFVESGTSGQTPGGYWDFGSGLPNGLVDDVRIYNRALSGVEVQELYQIESVPEPSSLSLLLAGGLVALARRRKF